MIGFTGTRDGMTQKQKDSVLQLLTESEETIVGHGDCVGADADFDALAATLGLRRHLYPGNLRSYRAHCETRGGILVTFPAEPLVRNGWILSGSTSLIATPKEYGEVLRSGTWSTIRKARKIKLPVYLVLPNGEIQ